MCGFLIKMKGTDSIHSFYASVAISTEFYNLYKGLDWVLNSCDRQRPLRSQSTNAVMTTPSPLARELNLGASRSTLFLCFFFFYWLILGIGTSPIREMIRPIAIRPDNSDGNLTSLVSPLSSLSISANYNRYYSMVISRD